MLAVSLLSKQPSEVYYYIKEEGGERIGKGGGDGRQTVSKKVLFVFDKSFHT